MKLFDQIFELIFPARCVNCGRLGAFICPNCTAKIVTIRSQTCGICNRITPNGKTCPRCRRKTELYSVLSYGYLKDPIMKKIVYSFKYEKLSAMAPTLAQMLIDKITEENLNFDLIVPVSISRKRKAWRGFNQAELLAKGISNKLGIPAENAVAKVKDTKTQVGLTKKQRLENLKSAYKCIGDVQGKSILLIDDVITTGSTLTEIADVLKKSGAKRIMAATIAKE
jgi:competence protein ComFC